MVRKNIWYLGTAKGLSLVRGQGNNNLYIVSNK